MPDRRGRAVASTLHRTHDSLRWISPRDPGRQSLSAATVNRATKALAPMFHLAIRLDRLRTMPHFPKTIVENPPRQGFFEHHDYD